MRDIKGIVNRIVSEFGTRSPFEIADYLGVVVREDPLGMCKGYCVEKDGVRVVVLNESLEYYEKRYALAHEVGHIILHGGVNEAFIAFHTLLKTSKAEREADKFAVELLLPDDEMSDYRGLTVAQTATATRLEEYLIGLKLESG